MGRKKVNQNEVIELVEITYNEQTKEDEEDKADDITKVLELNSEYEDLQSVFDALKAQVKEIKYNLSLIRNSYEQSLNAYIMAQKNIG